MLSFEVQFAWTHCNRVHIQVYQITTYLHEPLYERTRLLQKSVQNTAFKEELYRFQFTLKKILWQKYQGLNNNF